MSSQTISKNEAIVTINEVGDTLISFNLIDAKCILGDLLDYQIVDSLLTEYIKHDSIQSGTIMLQARMIKDLQLKSVNYESQISNLNQILSNKDTEIGFKDEIIKKQKKEIRKQKFLKVVGFSIAVILPVTIAILQHM